jgi:hypothetical protein
MWYEQKTILALSLRLELKQIEITGLEPNEEKFIYRL